MGTNYMGKYSELVLLNTLKELRDAVKMCVDLKNCGHADGVSLILVDAVKEADIVLEKPKSLFPNAIRLMRARHKLDSFTRNITSKGLPDVICKNYLAAICEELRLIELQMYIDHEKT